MIKKNLLLLFLPIIIFSQGFDKIDNLINSSIRLKAFPGAQVYIKKNDLEYIKSYGFHTYDSIIKVRNDHLYDLASLTKVFSSTLALMKLSEEKKILLSEPVSNYLKKLKTSNKKNSTFNDLLMHISGWIPYINHQQHLIKKNGKLKKRFISPNPGLNKKQIAKNIFIKSNYYKTVIKRIKKTKIENVGDYLYSGLFYCLVPEIVEKVTLKKFEIFLNEEIYSKFNVNLLFNPANKYPLNKIVPSEIDKTFRNQLIHGYVHDETAAIMGGVSGNAGLFGCAADIGKISQILLNHGILKNESIFLKQTIDNFTNPSFKNNSTPRGLGFDKPRFDSEGESIYSKKLSKSSYGHTGFTGTFFWVDPDQDLIVVLLTNRVFPSRESEKIYELEVRDKLTEIALEINL